jgi:4-diphosphocytidyl-2-C-methyl-D-erythritol kinase
MLTLSAPAKINLYLHITGKRADGYHVLDTAFQLVGLYDTVKLAVRKDGRIVLHTPIAGLLDADHLAIRAAQQLKNHSQTGLGADVWVNKRIPAGAGLGGGSSDAASTLMGLNQLWRCGLDAMQLQSLGLQLGADVPFFCSQLGSAHAVGVGEVLTPFQQEPTHYVIVFPNAHVSTPAVFRHPDLTWSEKRAIISISANFIEKIMRNDLQAVAIQLAPSIQDAISFLESTVDVHDVRMTGTGSAVFAQYATQVQAQSAVLSLNQICQARKWSIWYAPALSQHPNSTELLE